MSPLESQAVREAHREGIVHDRISIEVLTGASAVEMIGGLGTVGLAILGLCNVLPDLFIPIATMAVGVALLIEGGAIASRYAKLLHDAGVKPAQRRGLGGGMTAEFFGGLAGLVLGFLALVNVTPVTLTAVAAVVFGAALLFGSAATFWLAYFGLSRVESHEGIRFLTHPTVAFGFGGQLFVGLGSIVLGILALVGISTAILTLIALLSIGSAILLSGSVIGSRMLTLLRG